MDKQRSLSVYMWSVVAVGTMVFCFYAYRLPLAGLRPPFLFLALLAVVASSFFAVPIPRVSGRITVTDTFIFLTMLLYGGAPAILLATADGLFASLRISKRPRTILFNAAVMACSTGATVWTLRRLFGPIVELTYAGYTVNLLSAICVMGLTQYAANSSLIAVEKSYKMGQTVWATWKNYYLWTSVTYIAGASAAGISARLVGTFGFYAVSLTVPIIVIIYFTYRTYLENVEGSQARAREAERHVEELNHYIAELERSEKERERLLVGAQQARAEAEAANRIKDEFLATLSHELRTPLTSILGWANLLRTLNLDAKTIAQAFEAIERNAQMQKHLIDDLLDVSRIITGKLRLDVRPLALAPVIEEAIAVVRPAAAANHIQLVAAIDSNVGEVSGDPERLRQVVWNLLSNAVKFTRQGGRIEIRLEREGSRAKVSIADTGKGINPDFLPFVFDRFRQADGTTTRAHDGLGLGLAIVRHLVEAHGGTVGAESPGEGQGATFIITLPLPAVRLKPAASVPFNHGVAQQPVRAAISQLNGVRVLVVDDDDDARQMLSTVLSLSGAEVRASASASEALEELHRWQPDVLLSDIGMPHEDGYALIQRVRALAAAQGGHVPAAALTAYARDEDRERALAAGFQLHVAKPIGSVELIRAVAHLAQHAP